jgi:hypothetical protein
VGVGGCARFPDTPETSFTKLSFRLRVAGAINDSRDDTPLTSYVYIVAIRVLTTEEIPNTGSPQPVINDNSPNGFVAGSPTHFVVYDSQRPAQPFTLNKFLPGPTPGDPDNPINLAQWTDTAPTRGRIVNYSRPGDPGADPRELRFEIFANQLVDSDDQADQIRRIQVNILTMNRLSNQGSGQRTWDALGDTRNPAEINTFLNIDVRANLIVDNLLGTEPADDTAGALDPDADLIDYTIEIERP